MTKEMITIHNVETGEIIEREMNESELAQQEADLLDYQTQKAASAQKAVEKAALLEQLGITQDQAKLLLS